MPERTCICCRKKNEKEDFFRITNLNDNYIFDEDMREQSRGFYICRDLKCLNTLHKHKKYKVPIEIILKMSEKLVGEKKKSIIDILKPMVTSNNFFFGVDDNIKEIKSGKVKLLIIPRDIKEKYIEEFKKISMEKGISIIFIKEKKELIEVFNRDVNVVGIYGKKVVKGILNKVEVTDEDIRNS